MADREGKAGQRDRYESHWVPPAVDIDVAVVATTLELFTMMAP